MRQKARSAPRRLIRRILAGSGAESGYGQTKAGERDISATIPTTGLR
jgi:hypothetical protein